MKTNKVIENNMRDITPMENSKIQKLFSVMSEKTECRYAPCNSYEYDSRRAIKMFNAKYYDGFEEDVKKYGEGLNRHPILGLPLSAETPNWGEAFVDPNSLEYENELNISDDIEAKAWLITKDFKSMGEVPFPRDYAEQIGRIIRESDFAAWCPSAYSDAKKYITNESEFVFISFFGWNQRPKELRDQLVTIICLINPK